MFQFTQPKRAATINSEKIVSISSFNSRSPSGLRRASSKTKLAKMTVSIHAAQAGCDTLATSQGSTQVSFNSRSPSGLRQVVAIQLIYSADVSIHAAQAGCDYGGISRTFLRSVSIHAAQAGCDTLQTTIRTLNAGFNSRSPSGLRQYLSLISSTEREFQFTQPKRAATKYSLAH